MQKTTLAAAMVLAVFATAPAMAQHSHHATQSHGSHGSHGSNSGHGDHSGSSMKTKKKSAKSKQNASTREYHAAHAKMMRDMDLPFSGDADADFYTHMIPHHQGAIDMARVALRHAKDPWTRQAAEAIIIAQQQEIAQFQAWLARNGRPVPPGGQPLYETNSRSLPDPHKREPGSRDELVGQTWAPGSGVPQQR